MRYFHKACFLAFPSRLNVTMLTLTSLLALAASFSHLARADNPFVQTLFTADPAPLVYDGRVYAFLDHDNTGATTYDMTDWRLYSTADMVN